MRDDFAIFILTHGRPNTQLTYNTLMQTGYTGKYYMVLDDTDATIQQYIDNYGPEHIIVFDKNHYINTSEVGTNTPSYKCILYAKNAAEDIAKALNLKAFVIADDDIHTFRFRYPEGDLLRSQPISISMDRVAEAYVEFLIETNSAAVGFGPTLCYFAGASIFDNDKVQTLRIPYNFTFRNTSIPVSWVSSYGEDVITDMIYSKVGQKWMVLPFVQFDCVAPGSGAEGGMADTYKSHSQFKLVMYDFMYLPASIKPLLHQGKKWVCGIQRTQSFPKIISESYKKEFSL